jgi:3' exoribonuclease, RNase T-like
MRYFFDTEFYEDGRTIDLISIGIVAQDGREFYAVNRDAQLHRVSDWVRSNVLRHLPNYGDPAWMSRQSIAEAVKKFVIGEPEFWAYYADYDWVVLCQLFGTMMDLPKGWPMFCRDLKQLSVDVGSPTHPASPVNEHNALADAGWNKDLYSFLMKSVGLAPPYALGHAEGCDRVQEQRLPAFYTMVDSKCNHCGQILSWPGKEKT